MERLYEKWSVILLISIIIGGAGIVLSSYGKTNIPLSIIGLGMLSISAIGFVISGRLLKKYRKCIESEKQY